MVALPEGEFGEGAAVAVLASTVDEPVGLTSAEEEALIESLTAIRSGNYISSEDLLRQSEVTRSLAYALQISPRAARQIEQASDWWYENRLAAPSLFSSELERGFLALA